MGRGGSNRLKLLCSSGNEKLIFEKSVGKKVRHRKKEKNMLKKADRDRLNSIIEKVDQTMTFNFSSTITDDEPKYCICQNAYYGDMIQCDNYFVPLNKPLALAHMPINFPLQNSLTTYQLIF